MVSSCDGCGDLLFFSDPYPLPFFTHSSIELPQENSNNYLSPFSPCLFSFSPPTANAHLEKENENHTPRHPNIKTKVENYSASDDSEECQLGVDYTYNQHFAPHSYSGTETASKLIQRSLSCNSIDGKPGFLFEPHLDTLRDSLNFQWHALSLSSLAENSFFTGQMRRVCSTGDLQNTKATGAEESYFKVGRYSAEERKEKISKYRAKRSQRKFHKTIKYACRKTLADNRTRIRGRFARNDEIPKAPSSTREEEEDDFFWIELAEGLDDELLS